jgi:hypothetical protein
MKETGSEVMENYYGQFSEILAGCGKIDRQRVFVSVVHR